MERFLSMRWLCQPEYPNTGPNQDLYYHTLSLFLCRFPVHTLAQKLIFPILTHNPKKLCRKHVEPSTKSPKWLKLHPLQKIGHKKMIISHLCADIIRRNFTNEYPRAWYLGIRENFSKFLKFDQVISSPKVAQLRYPPSYAPKNIKMISGLISDGATRSLFFNQSTSKILHRF